jgi:hypothetical protein
MPGERSGVTALSVYPFKEPRQPIVLYEGPVGGLATNDARLNRGAPSPGGVTAG